MNELFKIRIKTEEKILRSLPEALKERALNNETFSVVEINAEKGILVSIAETDKTFHKLYFSNCYMLD